MVCILDLKSRILAIIEARWNELNTEYLILQLREDKSSERTKIVEKFKELQRTREWVEGNVDD